MNGTLPKSCRTGNVQPSAKLENHPIITHRPSIIERQFDAAKTVCPLWLFITPNENSEKMVNSRHRLVVQLSETNNFGQ
jgi:hypothetical protein